MMSLQFIYVMFYCREVLYVVVCMRGACTAFARAQPPWDTSSHFSLETRSCLPSGENMR